MYYSAIVSSNVQIRMFHSKTTGATDFIRSENYDRYMLNGDIVGGWHLRKNSIKKETENQIYEFF